MVKCCLCCYVLKWILTKKSYDYGLFSDLLCKYWKFGILFRTFETGFISEQLFMKPFVVVADAEKIARPDIHWKFSKIALWPIAYLDLDMRNPYHITHRLHSILKHEDFCREKICFMTCAIIVDQSYTFMEGLRFSTSLIYPAELQLNEANYGYRSTVFGFEFINILMVRFQLKFMINGTILILIYM